VVASDHVLVKYSLNKEWSGDSLMILSVCACVIRCEQPEYHLDKDLDDQLKEKRVSCPTDGCSYKAPLRFYLLHSHGRLNYSNADVDFVRIQSEHRRFPPLPSLAALDADNVAAGAMDIREQLMQASD